MKKKKDIFIGLFNFHIYLSFIYVKAYWTPHKAKRNLKSSTIK